MASKVIDPEIYPRTAASQDDSNEKNVLNTSGTTKTNSFTLMDIQSDRVDLTVGKDKLDFINTKFKENVEAFGESPMSEIGSENANKLKTEEMKYITEATTPMNQDDSPLSTAEDKSMNVIRKLKEILKGFGRLAKKVRDNINVAEEQSIECEGTNEDFYCEYKDIISKIDSVIDILLALETIKHGKEIDGFSNENRKKIYCILRIVDEGIKVQISRLNLMKTNYETTSDDLEETSTNSSLLDITVAKSKRKALIFAINCFIRILSSRDLLIRNILRLLEDNTFSQTSEDKIDSIISELKEIVGTFQKSSNKMRDIEMLSQSMNIVLESVEDKETCCSEMMSSFSDDFKERQEEFWLQFKPILDKIGSCINNVICENFYEFSLENQKEIYFHLFNLCKTIEYHIDRLHSIKSNFEKFRSFYDKMEFSIILSHNDITSDTSNRQQTFITTVSDFIYYLSDYNFLSFCFLDILWRKAPSLFFRDEVSFILGKLRKIINHCNESTTEEIETRNETESLISDRKSMEEENIYGRKVLNFISDIKKKIKFQEELCYEIKSFLDETEFILDYLKFQKVDRFSIGNQKKVYFALKKARVGIQVYTDHLESLILNRKSCCKGCDGYRDMAIDVSERQTTFFKEISEFVKILSEQNSLATNILKSLEQNFDSPLTDVEIKSETIIKNMKNIVVQLNEFTTKEMEVRKLSESLNTDIESIKEKGTKTKQVVKLLHGIQDNLETLEDFKDVMISFIEKIKYIIISLEKVDYCKNLPERQTYVYFYLLILLDRLNFLIKTLNSIQYSHEKFSINICKIKFPVNSPAFAIVTDISDKEKRICSVLKAFLKYLTNYEAVLSLILKTVSSNLKSNANVSSPSGEGSSVGAKDRPDLIKDRFQSFHETDSYDYHTMRFLKSIERKVDMCVELVRECKIFLDITKKCVILKGTSHLSLASKNQYFGKLLLVRREITSKYQWLKTTKLNVEKLKSDIEEAHFFKCSPHISLASELQNKLIPIIIAMAVFMEDLKRYEVLAVKNMRLLEKEIKSDIEAFSSAI